MRGNMYICMYTLIIVGTPTWEREEKPHGYPVAIIFTSWAVSQLGEKTVDCDVFPFHRPSVPRD